MVFVLTVLNLLDKIINKYYPDNKAYNRFKSFYLRFDVGFFNFVDSIDGSSFKNAHHIKTEDDQGLIFINRKRSNNTLNNENECPQCGTQANSLDKFCQNCGYKVKQNNI